MRRATVKVTDASQHPTRKGEHVNYRRMNRRTFLTSAVVAAGCAATAPRVRAEDSAPPLESGGPIDLHVHLDHSTIDAVVALGAERHVRFGIVEHAGIRANDYPVVLSDDAELAAYCDMLEGKGVFKGIQAEWTDWMGCFSKDVLKRLDYVLTDAMTMPRSDGTRMKLWAKDAEIGEAQAFMDRYVDWHLEILSTQRFDILANVTWLPERHAADYDTLWTDERIGRIVEAAAKRGVAIEISSSLKAPSRRFLETVKSAGVKFTYGSNGRYPNMGLLEYSLEMGRVLGLTAKDLYVPTPGGSRAVATP